MGFFSKAFKSKGDSDVTPKSKKKPAHVNGAVPAPPPKPRWEDAWTRKDVEAEEVQDLLRICTQELKSRALDLPFLLLPFRPASDPSAARTFIRNFFSDDKVSHYTGERLEQEMMLTEPMVIGSIMKWCWSRLAGGVVTWEAYELFRVGEQDSDLARDAFATFVPLSVDSDARSKIIFDYFDLMAAIAAHGKTNGMAGRKLSRLAGWWAFEQIDTGSGFDGGYRSWSKAADATSHLFFAYLRSLSPDSVRGINGISNLPLSLQALVNETRYPPEHAPYEAISRVVMVVDSVSPTPFSLLRRARRFEYREDDKILNQFSDYEDPAQALTDECRRVLKSISAANQSQSTTAKLSTSLGDSSWSRFEDMGFGSLGDLNEEDEVDSALGKRKPAAQGLKSAPASNTNDLGRPTTPSWADFLSSGFADEPSSPGPRPLLLPPDKVLPPIDLDSRRGKSSQSHKRPAADSDLEPGELASINALDLDDAFWWVWMTSLAGEETSLRKAAFGRCALLETVIGGGAWLVIEEMVKGAAPEPDEMGAYVAEKKSRFTFGKRSKASRTRSMGRSTPQPKTEPMPIKQNYSTVSKTNIGPDQHARIQAAAAALQQKQRHQENDETPKVSPRRARQGDAMSTKTNSVFTLQPVIMSEAAPAMKWANSYDKKAVRAAYLGDNFAGKGSRTDLASESMLPPPDDTPRPTRDQTKPDYGFPKAGTGGNEPRDLPALPPETPGEKPSAPSELPPPVPSKADGAPGSSAFLRNDPFRNAPPAPLPPEPSSKPPAPPPHDDEGDPLEQTQTITQSQPNLPPTESSPENNSSGKKLKKQPGSGGLRSIFGTKKKNQSPVNLQVPDSSAVAAARAAYSGPQTRRHPPSSKSLTRRLSGIGRKKTPVGTTSQTTESIEDGDEPLPPPPAPFKENNFQSQTTLSRIDTNEERQADHEFQTFDQHGPLDQPAFVPEESARNSLLPESEASRPSTTATDHRTGPHFDPPIGHGEYEPSVSTDDGAETEHEDTNGRPYSPEKNRWSQIRRNAAERAGRMSEEQNNKRSAPDTRTDDRTEDEEESGAEESGAEETIESRVARIKARVAELTGGMSASEVRA